MCEVATLYTLELKKLQIMCNIIFCDGAALMGERRKTLYYTYQLAKRRDLIL